MRRFKRLGVSIGTSLLAVALVVTVGFTLASVSVSHLTIANKADNTESARNLAHSAVSEGLARILESKDYGETKQASESVEVTFDDLPGTGKLSFDPVTANSWGIPYSVNNLDGSASVEGGRGGVVPLATVQLIGVGEVNGTIQTVEATLVIPPFPFAVASGGPIHSRGGVLIAGLKPGAEPSLEPDALAPADLLTNDTSSRSVRFGANTRITGDVQSAGGIELSDPSIVIQGEVRTQASPESIPELDPRRYDPARLAIDYEELDSTADRLPERLTGVVRASDSVTFDGNLELDGGTLFVDGDLTVRGGITGTGVVIVRGETALLGGAGLETESQVALLSEGQVTLRGQGPHSSRFTGLVYTDEGVTAEQISLVGTMVARGERAGIELRDTHVFYERPAILGPGEQRLLGRHDFDVALEVREYTDDGMSRRAGIQGNYDRQEELWNASEQGRSPQNASKAASVAINFRATEIELAVDGDVVLIDYPEGASLADTNLESELAAALTSALVNYGANATQAAALAQQIIAQLVAPGRTVTELGELDSLLTMGPSEFLKSEERIRLALWREF